MPTKTYAQLYAENPLKPGESQWSYQQRIGQLQAASQDTAANVADLVRPFTNIAKVADKWTDPSAPMAPWNPLASVRALLSPAPPQGQNEPNWQAAGRNTLSAIGSFDPVQAFLGPNKQTPGEAIGQFLSAGVKALPQTMAYATDTPAQRQQRQATAGAAASSNVFPKSFRDPAYDAADQAAEKRFGLPPGLLSSIRTNGERTNAGVTSSAGAYTPYQIIPSTRAGIQKNYGFDPYSSPQNAANGAAAVLAENYKKTGDWGKAVRGYVGGFGPQSAANAATSDSYMSRVMGAVNGAGGGLQTGYDPQYDQAALGQINTAEQQALKPFSTSLNVPDAPQAPTLATVAPTDFTASDKALEALKPAEMTEAAKLSLRRSKWLEGIGQALAASPEGVGVGKLLAMIGGGGLMGTAAGDAEVRARTDKFDEQMARYNVAVYNNDTMKAQTAHAEAVANVDAQNKTALMNYQTSLGTWQKYNNVSVSDTGVTSSAYDPATGKVTVNRLPIESAVRSAFALNRAQVMSGIGQNVNQGNRLVAQQRNALVIGAAGVQAANEPTGSDAAAAVVTAPAFVASRAVTDGAWPDLVGKDGYAQLSKEGLQYITRLGLTPGTQQAQDALQQWLATQITTRAMGDQTFMKNLMAYQSNAATGLAVDRFVNQKNTTRTNQKGQTSTEVQQ